MPFAAIVNNASPPGKYDESISAAIRRSPLLFRKYTRVCAACASGFPWGHVTHVIRHPFRRAYPKGT